LDHIGILLGAHPILHISRIRVKALISILLTKYFPVNTIQMNEMGGAYYTFGREGRGMVCTGCCDGENWGQETTWENY
jgi:hypothetical protein